MKKMILNNLSRNVKIATRFLMIIASLINGQAAEDLIKTEHTKISNFIQAHIDYHARMEFTFSNVKSGIIKKGSVLDVILDAAQKTKLNYKKMGPTIIESSRNQHENFRLAFEKWKNQIEKADFDMKIIGPIARDLELEEAHFWLRDLLSGALPLNRKTPGTENQVRSDRMWKVNYKKDGSAQLEERNNLLVFPTLPESWCQYMTNENTDHHASLKWLVSSLKNLMQLIIKRNLGITSEDLGKTNVIQTIESPIEAQDLKKKFNAQTKSQNPVQKKAVPVPSVNIDKEPFNEKDTSEKIADLGTGGIEILDPISEIKTEDQNQEIISDRKAESPTLIKDEPIKFELSIQSKNDSFVKDPAPMISIIKIQIKPKFENVRQKIANLQKVSAIEFFGFMQELEEKAYVKLKENNNGLLVWFGTQEVHLFHRVHNRGFVMEDGDLRVANKALNNINLTVERF